MGAVFIDDLPLNLRALRHIGKFANPFVLSVTIFFDKIRRKKWKIESEKKPVQDVTDISIFTSVGTTRGQGIIRIVVTFFKHSHFWKILKTNKAQILTF